jgi:hypothetical protein
MIFYKIHGFNPVVSVPSNKNYLNKEYHRKFPEHKSKDTEKYGFYNSFP